MVKNYKRVFKEKEEQVTNLKDIIKIVNGEIPEQDIDTETKFVASELIKNWSKAIIYSMQKIADVNKIDIFLPSKNVSGGTVYIDKKIKSTTDAVIAFKIIERISKAMNGSVDDIFIGPKNMIGFWSD